MLFLALVEKLCAMGLLFQTSDLRYITEREGRCKELLLVLFEFCLAC